MFTCHDVIMTKYDVVIWPFCMTWILRSAGWYRYRLSMITDTHTSFRSDFLTNFGNWYNLNNHLYCRIYMYVWPHMILVTYIDWRNYSFGTILSAWILKVLILYEGGAIWIYRQVSNIRRTLVGNKIVDHSDVVGASPAGAAPTTSSFST